MAKSRMAVEEQETIAATDTELSVACDAVLDARAQVNEANKVLHAADTTLINLMQQDGKKSIKHEGHRFQLVHQEEKNKIQIKSE